MSTKKIAKLVSLIIGPGPWLSLLSLVFIFKTGLNKRQITILTPVLLNFHIFIPLAAYYLTRKFLYPKDPDFSNKKAKSGRLIVLASSFFSYFLSLIIIHFLGNTFLFHLILILILLNAIILITTYFYKISLHVSMSTFALIMFNFLFNWKFPFLYLLIPLVAWSRIKLKKHTLDQVLAAFILNATFILLALRFFNYF